MIPIGETQDGRADMTNFEMDLFDARMNSYSVEKEESEQCCKHTIIKPACIPISIISLFIFMIVFFPLFNEDSADATLSRYERSGFCMDQCSLGIVESIPTNLTYPNFTQTMSTYEAWKSLLDNAAFSIDLAVFYWNLRDNFRHPTAWQGQDIFDRIVLAAKRGIRIRIAQNMPSHISNGSDSEFLASNGYASVRTLNFSSLLGAGVLHTKFWIVDARHVYIGSANMDWKSLTEVKELGYLISNCTCIAHEFSKIFAVYRRLGVNDAKIPKKWPINLRTFFNFSHPLDVYINEQNAKAFISNSPPRFNTKGRESDDISIVKAMEDAKEFIHVSVMDYLPTTLYMGKRKNFYWPMFDDAIKSAAYRGITVRLLVGNWSHSKPAMIPFLRSLTVVNQALPRRFNSSGKIEVKLFTIPSNEEQRKIPFTRVNHNKFMVTDRIAYVGTSNWAGDYFINTAGVGAAIILPSVVESLNRIFCRDWYSQYAVDLEHVK